jgi:hypothetical protein
MKHMTVRGLGAVVMFALGTLMGCGDMTDAAPVDDGLQSQKQALYPCTPDYQCPSGNTCVRGTCRPVCGAPPIEEANEKGEETPEALMPGTCASGSRCCPGYYYSPDRITQPYCMPNAGSCATFP